MSDLIIVRGLPGSGKSTLSKVIAPSANVAADDYFDKYHGGVFKSEEIKTAHDWCKGHVENYMLWGAPVIAVHNTFTQYWEMEEYFRLANKHLYDVHTIIVENRHGSKSIHNVPKSVIDKMQSRFQIKLR